ncbi:transducin/WD40 repeat-like superfamily protein [Tanacetum coccineum]
MGGLSNPKVALATFGGKSFSHAKYLEDLEDPEDAEYERQLSEEDGHAVVITCVNTMSDDHNEHFVVIKNSYGAEWGLKGYARVAFDFFDEILVPRLDQDCRGNEEEKENQNEQWWFSYSNSNLDEMDEMEKGKLRSDA